MKGLKLLFVVAALACGAASPALAASVYTTSFETSSGYSLGGLNGQDGWLADADAVVQGASASSGQQSVQMTANADDYTGMFNVLAAHAFVDPTGANPQVTITQDVRVTARDEAEWEIAASGGLAITNIVRFTSSGAILVNNNYSGYYWQTNQWRTLQMVLDFNSQTMDVYYGGNQIADNAAFLDSGGFTMLTIAGDDNVFNGSQMYYDNLSITAAPVPEPTSLALIGLGLLGVWRRRRG